MKRTFSSEDGRKNRLFEAWIEHLGNIHSQFSENDFEEIFEGLATVSELSENNMGVHLEDGRKMRYVAITPEIQKESARLDLVYLVIGRRAGKWWPLDVISIGSTVDPKQGAVHITFNPLLVGAGQPLGH